MPIFALSNEVIFPPPYLAGDDGILAVGGDLRPDRLLLAYRMGIFPWPAEGFPLLWHCPNPRMILRPADLHVGKTLRKTIRKKHFEVRLDTAFQQVMEGCAEVYRPGQGGTWITEEMIDAYTELHRRGVAHSAEAWDEGTLVGGLYGLSLGTVFFGESMFARASDASKVAFVHLVRQLGAWGIDLIDCQVHTDHLARFGAHEIPRDDFLSELGERVANPTKLGPWAFDDDRA